MFNRFFTSLLRMSGPPAFLVYGKSCKERDWRIVALMATHRRNWDSGWPRPFFAGTAITWTDSVIACGWDFAKEVLREQMAEPASREHPVHVLGGRLRVAARREAVGADVMPTSSEVVAHECGHTHQARRLSWLYLPKGAVFTLCREGDGWLHAYENEASETGLFGGIVPGSVHPRLWAAVND